MKLTKNRKLVLGLLMDGLGYLSYIVPLFGDFSDVLWAPISAYIMTKLYKGTLGKTAGVINFIEEALPVIDFIPTFTLTWVYEYVLKKKNK